MTEAIVMPQKRVLGDASNNPRGVVNSPDTIKKRKIDMQNTVKPSPRAPNGQRKVGSSQQKSQFEEEVLEKLTQDISGLKENNSEKDQQWERPPLGEFDPTKDNICFQQIDAEEGTTMGKPAIRLFGVTEVWPSPAPLPSHIFLTPKRLASQYFSMLLDFSTICILPLLLVLQKRIATPTERS